MGVAAYETKIVSSLPKKLKGTLPTIEEIEAELSTVKTIGKSIPARRKAVKRGRHKKRRQ
jgi:hypothetical protein